VLGPHRELEAGGHEVRGFFYNPNIHPLIEFRRRRKSLKVLQERIPLPVDYPEGYGLHTFLKQVEWDGPRRCADCYRLRLGRTAREARRGRYDAFSTTLLASRHQDHDMVCSIGEECAGREGVEFLARDWRAMADSNRQEAGRPNLYLQQYCGCVFSEEERYRDTTRHLYRGGGARQ
jgi:hypothetical protein